MINIFSHSKDNILLILATIRVNLNQSSHTHSAQTITPLITIPFSQQSLLTSLSYKNLIFRNGIHQRRIKRIKPKEEQDKVSTQQMVHSRMQNH